MQRAGLVEWGQERATDLSALVDDVMPEERLSHDELLSCCWDDPGTVLAFPGGEGVAAAVVRSWGDWRIGYLKLLAVLPAARRLGMGRALLDGAASWAFDQGAREFRLGGSAPFYLWPGVDVRWTAALCLAERAGYRPDGAELNLSCPTTYRADPPSGVATRRVLDDTDAESVLAFSSSFYSMWVPELARGIEQGGAFAAFADPAGEGASDAEGVLQQLGEQEQEVVGFACHSVNRSAWVGPMATHPHRQHGGVGGALLAELCRDLMVAGHADAEISWVGPITFYAKTAGATVSRVFRNLVISKP
jgi:GNAT superfamily N-acetyltransferase